MMSFCIPFLISNVQVLNSRLQSLDDIKNKNKDWVIATCQFWSGKLDILRNKHSQTLSKSKDDCNQLLMANNTKMTKLLTVKDSKMKKMMTTKDNEMKRRIIAKDNKINN